MSGHRLLARGALAAVLAVSAAPSSQAEADTRNKSAALSEPAPVFPKIAGWKISDGPTKYSPDTLFEFIDGGADSFLQFDFQDLASATYANGKIEVTVDIYHHRDAVRAFGMYTQERPAGTTRLPIGVEGYVGPDHLEFVVGSYYVKLVQSGGGEPSVLRRFAENVSANLPGTRKAPAILQAFPERGKRDRAEKLAARDFLGHAFLHDAVAVPYAMGGANFRLFVVEGKDSAEARAMVKRYLGVGKSPDAGADAVASEGSSSVKDPLNGAVELRWKGRWLWGAVDQPCPERASLVDELGRNISLLGK
jgi:hypothetical protein